VRCFVALFPDERAAQQLAELTTPLLVQHPHARALRAEDLHLTLAFIGQLSSERAQSFARELPTKPAGVVWALDRLGTFTRARVLWAGGAEHPELGALAQQTRAMLTNSEIPFDPRPFVPHITLARGITTPARPTALPAPVPCRFGAVRLVESTTGPGGSRYRPLDP
jgi:2'-5' RNA ligase